jgi:hypothetical protein
MKRRALFAVLVLGIAGVACQVVAGISRVDQVDPIPDGGPEGGGDGGPPPDPCRHNVPPSMPDTDDDPNTSIDDFYIALRSVTLLAPVGETLGFDLDGVCSCDVRPNTAHDGGQSCQTTKKFCDGDGGVDNQVATFATDFAPLIDIDKAANVNARIQRGQQTSLIVVSKYNGRANDREVAFGLFTSEGIPANQPQPGCPDAGSESGFLAPGWCGKDKWTVSASTVVQLGTKFTPKAVGTGYVSNYRFVVRFSGAAAVPFAGYRLSLGSPVSSGLLVPLGPDLQPLDTKAGPPPKDQIAFWRLDNGMLAGRIPVSDLLAAVGTVNTPGGDGGPSNPHLCSTPTFAAVKSEVCGRQDINSTLNLDFATGAACDALSTAIGLTGGPAQVDAIVTAPAPQNDCFPTEDGGGPVGFPAVTYRCP